MEDRKIVTYPTAPERRKKVTQACDYCKKRKYKCIGKAPCELCKKKNMVCQFSIVDRRTTKGVKKQPARVACSSSPSPNSTTSTSKTISPHSKLLPDSLLPSPKDPNESTPSTSNSTTDSMTTTTNPLCNESLYMNNTIRPLNNYIPYYNFQRNQYNYSRPPQDSRSFSIAQINSSSTDINGLRVGNCNKLPPASKLLKSTYIPKSLQPLLSFPLQDTDDLNHPVLPPINVKPQEIRKNENSAIHDKEEPKVSVEADSSHDVKMEDDSSEEPSEDPSEVPRILFDFSTSTRYIGESSPLSLLFESRNIFKKFLGDSEFSCDTSGINILEKPIQLKPGVTTQLPERDVCDKLLVFFQNNINQSWYIFNMDYFTEHVVDRVYQNEAAANVEKLALVHLVLALGLLFAETSKSPLLNDLDPNVTSLRFFESGFNMIRNTVDDGKLWITEAYFLVYFYYQSSCNSSTSWLMLGTAIRNAQALGLHRKFINESYKDKQYVYHRKKLWLSLYVCDRMSSILLGRPLLIVDYDWDDFEKTEELVQSEPKNSKNIVCLVEIAKVAVLNGKIVQNFYLNGTIDPIRAEKLALDFRIWSINLHPDLQIDKALQWQNSQQAKGIKNSSVDNFSLFAVHLSQFYGIMLLCRPFFMYFAFRKPEKSVTSKPKRLRYENKIAHFCKASVKSSVLTIELIYFYMQQYCERAEVYPAVNCCFMAAITLGLSILHRKTTIGFDDEYTATTLKEKLVTGHKILTLLGSINSSAEQFSCIVAKMINALEDAYEDLGQTPVGSSLSSPEAESIQQSEEGSDNDYTSSKPNQYNSGESVRSGSIPHITPPSAASMSPIIHSPPSAVPTYHNSGTNPSGSSTTGTNPSGLESLLEFHQFFVPESSTNKFSSDDGSDTSKYKNDVAEHPYVYSTGASDILFANKL